MKYRYIILAILVTYFQPVQSSAQHESDIWLGGREEPSGVNTNWIWFNNNGTPQVDTVGHPGFLKAANSSYSDPQTGQLMAYTDGYRIFNRYNTIIPGGDSLSPVTYSFENWNYFDNYLVGSGFWNSVVILPMPGREDTFAVVHQQGTTSPPGPFFTSDTLFFSQFRMNDENPEGQMILKNEIVYDKSDGYNSHASSMAVIQHANGRDWWVLIGNSNFGRTQKSHKYHVFLLDPSGMHLDHIDKFYHEDGRWYNSFLMTVSKDGEKMAVIESDDSSEIRDWTVGIYAFNRCTGKVSTENRIQMVELEENPENGHSWGTPFSPDGRFLYIIYGDLVIQYDLEEENYVSKGDTVARWSEEKDEQAGVIGHSYFGPSRLAPNGKIYVSATADLTRFMHVIHHPNRKGEACDFEQNGLPLPLINKQTVPFYVNYNLGPIDGSLCDTLGIDATATTEVEWNNPVEIYPNPITGGGEIKIQFGRAYSGEVRMYDMTGRLIKMESCVKEKVLRYDIPDIATGVYNLVFKNNEGQQTSRKIVVK